MEKRKPPAWKIWKTGRFKKWKMRMLMAIVPGLFYLVTSIIFRTCRVTVIGKENEDQFLRKKEPVLFVSWHQGLLYFVFHFRNRNGIVMTSKSEDGDVIARVLKLYGFQTPPRGSSSRDGKGAMHEMIERIKVTRSSGGLLADAPRGPFGVAKMGIIKIAKETGLPIIPVIWWPKKSYMFLNWDRTLFPLPFTRIVFFYAGPIFIPKDASDEEMEKARTALSDQLNLMHKNAQQYFVYS